MNKIAIFVPVFNEAEKLAATLQSVPPMILGRKTEIIVVDDCSGDKSVEIAKRFTEHVLVMECNSGVGAVTKRGLEYISKRGGYEFVIKFDGDGQHDISKLTQVAGMLVEGNDIIVCSRFHPLSDQTHTPVDRIFLNMIFTEMVRKITGWNVTDVRSGYMGFKFEDVKMVASSLIVTGYGIPMELLLRVWHAKPKARVFEIPHPAVYGGEISHKLLRKYEIEKTRDKVCRLHIAYTALLAVVLDLQIPKEKILEMNGFLKS